MTAQQPGPWISVAEAAHRLSVSDKTIRRMIANGSIKATRVGPKLLRVDASTLNGEPIRPRYTGGEL